MHRTDCVLLSNISLVKLRDVFLGFHVLYLSILLHVCYSHLPEHGHMSFSHKKRYGPIEFMYMFGNAVQVVILSAFTSFHQTAKQSLTCAGV